MSGQWVAKATERDPNAWDVFTDEGVLIVFHMAAMLERSAP